MNVMISYGKFKISCKNNWLKNGVNIPTYKRPKKYASFFEKFFDLVLIKSDASIHKGGPISKRAQYSKKLKFSFMLSKCSFCDSDAPKFGDIRPRCWL